MAKKIYWLYVIQYESGAYGAKFTSDITERLRRQETNGKILAYWIVNNKSRTNLLKRLVINLIETNTKILLELLDEFPSGDISAEYRIPWAICKLQQRACAQTLSPSAERPNNSPAIN